MIGWRAAEPTAWTKDQVLSKLSQQRDIKDTLSFSEAYKSTYDTPQRSRDRGPCPKQGALIECYTKHILLILIQTQIYQRPTHCPGEGVSPGDPSQISRGSEPPSQPSIFPKLVKGRATEACKEEVNWWEATACRPRVLYI